MQEKKTPLDTESILAKLDIDGAIAKRLPFHEKRQAQLDLMELVIRAFNENELLVAEAGTGVGKSLAYLVPALMFADATDERIVLSTATITLQQQLFEKDIPTVISALGLTVKAALVKGRGNYLCLRRLAAAMGEQETFFDQFEQDTLQQIADWASSSDTGSRSDMPFAPNDRVWSGIASEADTCLGSHCLHRESCFVMAMRKKAGEARILVVNHHLLFADIAAREESDSGQGTVVLPFYRRVVIDEAHTINDAATSFFSQEFSKNNINLALGRLFTQYRTGRKSGLLYHLAAFSGEADRTDVWLRITDDIRDAAMQLDAKALELCGIETVFRLIPQRDAIIKTRLTSYFISLSDKIDTLAGEVSAMAAKVSEKQTDDERYCSESDSLVREVKAILQRITGIACLCKEFVTYGNYTDAVFWLERHTHILKGQGAKNWAVFTKAPLDVSSKLKATLFSKHQTVACVSATITVSGQFDYWIQRSGIMLAMGDDNERRSVLTGFFPSPFPYHVSVLTAAATDAPLPAEEGFQDFIDSAVYRLIEASHGSALSLFTSFESLFRAYDYAAPRLRKHDILCLKQGDDDRGRLLKTFISNEQSVLFATDSFWEGIDAPGDTLRLVILCRLPFKTPKDPVFQARCEAKEQQGEDPFMTLSVPEAVIKFRQGFGRLVRRSDDRGAVVILDSRIIKKRYGEIFLRSLPKTKTSFSTFDKALHDVEYFLSQ